MDSTLSIVIITIILIAIITPALFFFRRSTDIKLKGDILTLSYPFSKEEIDLSTALRRWNLQEAYFLRLGKIYAINLELKNGKWKTISSRFNGESFEKILMHLESKYAEKKEIAAGSRKKAKSN